MAPREAVQWKGYITDYLMPPARQRACQLLYAAALCSARRCNRCFLLGARLNTPLSADEEMALRSRAGRRSAYVSQAVQPCLLVQ